MSDSVRDITRLLNEAYDGRNGALDEVMAIVHADLERLAAKRLRQRYGSGMENLTLEPAALVNETFLKLIKQRKRYDSRGHFFAIATRLMLRVLVDHDRAKRRGKRGGDHLRVSLSGVARVMGEEPSAEIPAFVQALERLDKLSSRSAEVTTLRLVWGLTIPEIAESMNISVTTVEREWRFARRWLAAALTDD